MSSARTVLVTGGARGIGYGIARRFSERGDQVVIADIMGAPDAATRLSEEIGVEVRSADLDVTDESSVEALFASLTMPDVVVSCAGTYPNTPVMQLSVAEWDRVLTLNTTGSFLVGRAACRSMTARGTAGRLIFISSGAATSARVGAAHYCASKAGVDMLMRVLALEMGGTGITVNSIAPGLIAVERLEELDPRYISALVADLPVRRTGTPDDIAAAALFLASDDASYITGSVLTVDGGFGAGRPLPPS